MTFLDLLREHNVQLFESGSGGHTREGWVNFACPFCGGGKHKDSMGYNIQKNYVTCYRCGGHPLVVTLAEIAGKSTKECAALLNDLSRIKIEIEDKRGTLKLPKGRGPLQKPHRKYLRSRGFDPDAIAERWGVEGIGVASRLSWRLFIPIHKGADIVSWTTRAINPSAELRYVSASAEEEAVNHKTLLYGEHYAKHAICVVEGPLDVWKVGPGCVGTCGTGYSRAQLLRMARYPVRAICFDNEPQAQKRARELRDALSAFPGETLRIVLDAKDAGEASDKELRQLRRSIGL